MEEHQRYESPTLAEVGDFTDRTLGPDGWGWESESYCWFIEC
ncbi:MULTISPECIES: lasso RiPP family leader peptide-containing protein [unclassified Streptomyces]|nr:MULTISPECIES: lasso RiPP family leader peptide-containing protein [unclassified Streptomyces]WSA90723.1 lasso RiPP family leader peptide-containing protein [Streptomyces sp. NBC_01795]WSB75047.1 lasso RiPP family leader peptide-containing protein [Streptomyces sp. NBC_01775]WSS45491.1 lasso RiPP family leader peptide-containing protein [Streptomyces sp. NBC_01187]